MPSIAFLGDVMLGRLVNESAAVNGPGYVWGDTLGVLGDADLRIANLECVISDRGSPQPPEKTFHFRALPWAIDALRRAGIDYVSLANNHSLDYGKDALLDMLGRLDAAGIRHAGAGRGNAEASAPALLRCGGLRAAIFSSTDNEPGWKAGEGSPGVNFMPTLLRPEVLGPIGASATSARDEGADLVIWSSHWGPNMRPRPDPLYVSFARNMMGMGVDVFHGHSAHVFQGIESWEGRPIMFDTGDFVDDYAADPLLRNDWSFIFRLELGLRTKRARKIELIPTFISGCQANLAPEPLSGHICGRMASLCREMGTDVKMERGRLVIRP